ncbi:MAG: hypothetical protein GY950_20870 [bacterium]|nr:hypothetical protein [bacterium]
MEYTRSTLEYFYKKTSFADLTSRPADSQLERARSHPERFASTLPHVDSHMEHIGSALEFMRSFRERIEDHTEHLLVTLLFNGGCLIHIRSYMEHRREYLEHTDGSHRYLIHEKPKMGSYMERFFCSGSSLK